jgi:hypothetical protein
MLSMPRIVRPDPHRIRGRNLVPPLDRPLADPLSETKNWRNLLTGRRRSQVSHSLPAHLERFITDDEAASLRFHFETSKRGRGGRRYLPYAFTEQGVAMLSSVLRSSRAVQVRGESPRWSCISRSP